PQADGRLPGQHLAPLAFAAVLAALEPSPAHLRLDDNVLDRRFVDAVALEPPARHACGEDMICTIRRCRHLEALADGGYGDGPGHFSSLSFLATYLSTSA